MTAQTLAKAPESRAKPGQPIDQLVTEIAQAARFARQHEIAAIYHAGSGHPGGALSSADILASLFGAELIFWPDLSMIPIATISYCRKATARRCSMP